MRGAAPGLRRIRGVGTGLTRSCGASNNGVYGLGLGSSVRRPERRAHPTAPPPDCDRRAPRRRSCDLGRARDAVVFWRGSDNPGSWLASRPRQVGATPLRLPPPARLPTAKFAAWPRVRAADLPPHTPITEPLNDHAATCSGGIAGVRPGARDRRGSRWGDRPVPSVDLSATRAPYRHRRRVQLMS
jgi:hypothetical protein